VIYLMSYDLRKPGRNYDGLYQALKSIGPWWHYLESTWLISTQENATQIYNRVVRSIDPDDRLLIVDIGKDRYGWLP
jgi:hypothetical protein